MNALSYDEMRLSFAVSSAFAGLTIFLSLSILLLSLWIYTIPTARRHIERLSWRLFMVILGLQIIWAIVYLISYANANIAVMVGSTRIGCSTAMVLLTGTRLTVSWLITSIAVNLALSLRWNINNSSKRGLTKWYLAVSGFLGFVPPIVSAARGHFSGGSRYNTCYFKQVTPFRRYLIHVFLAFHFWLALATAIALIAVIISITSIFTQSRRTSRLLRQAAKISHAALTQQPTLPPFIDEKTGPSSSSPWHDRFSGSSGSSGSHLLSDPVAPPSTSGPANRFGWSWFRRHYQSDSHADGRPRRSSSVWSFLRRASSSSTSDQRRMSMYALDDAYLRIALRVAIYPVASVFLNVIYITTDLILYLYPTDLPESFDSLFMFGMILYSGRGAIFALIAIFIDPCFREGLKAAWAARKDLLSERSSDHTLVVPRVPAPTPTAAGNMDQTAICSFWDMLDIDSPLGGKSDQYTVASLPVSPGTLFVLPGQPVSIMRELDIGEMTMIKDFEGVEMGLGMGNGLGISLTESTGGREVGKLWDESKNMVGTPRVEEGMEGDLERHISRIRSRGNEDILNL